MAERSEFVAVPKFEGYYEHWAMLMENLLRSKEFWPLIETGVTIAPPNATVEQIRTANESKLLDLKVKNYLLQSIDRTIMETILTRETAKYIWEAMQRKFQGSTKVKRAQLQALRREFEILAMKESESVDEYFGRVLTIANRMTAHGERLEAVTIVEKILRSMQPKFNHVVCSIEVSCDVTSLFVEELQSSLIVHEQRMKGQEAHVEEQALKFTSGGRGIGRGRGRNFSRGRGRGRQSKELVECFKCHKLGHYKNECPDWGENANYAEFDYEEETLLMARTDENVVKEESWYGHISMQRLKLLNSKDMVKGLPALEEMDEKCTDCLFGKQQGEAIPKQAKWRATTKLQLIHSDICGPINPCSNGIKRQLTTTYTPQQNGVSERKNRTLLNMVRSMLASKHVPKNFWPDALKWATYVMNRSPTTSVKDLSPEEAWSGVKPFVLHFRVFGCLAYVHVPKNQRKKLDNRSIKCVLLGLSDESKAYKLYDPVEKEIMISKDVVFDEAKGWDWENRETRKSNNTDFDLLDETSAEEITPATCEVATPINEEITDGNGTGTEHQDTSSEEIVVSDTSSDDNNELDPESYDEASKSKKWRQAIDVEIEAIEANNTWELTDLPNEAKSIRVKWVYKTKYNENGQVDKYKARLVVKGYSQKYGIDYNEVFAPVARWETIRTVLALAASKGWCVYQLDVKSSFLHGDLEEDIYVEQPLGYQQGNKSKVYKLRKALYGLKQAPRAWYSKIEAHFLYEGFKKCPVEHTLFVKHVDQNTLIVSVYVDDLIVTGNNMNLINEFKVSMKRQFAMSDLGKMKFFLGVEVIQTDKGIFIHQMKYATEILGRFQMEKCNTVCSPIITGIKLVKDESGKACDAKTYKQMVGSLMYLLATRPDLAFVVCLVARFMDRPTEMHIAAIKRIMRYVKGTTDFGILYSKTNESLQLDGWSDSDYAGDLDDRKNTSGYVFMLGSGVISWSSKKQPIVTLSTTEAKFVAAASSACQSLWLRNVLEHLGLKQKGTTLIHCDNSSSINLSKNPILHGRCKHIDVRFHFLRDLTKDGIIELVHCKSENQLADAMTKPLKV
ncbi:hypothetical protein TSUD_131240 [Trifolium subterraneum]|uniref:CCHC-type domain-containing protein n=1 Tax=Trifolium subterraneum TaxID=3900 RepID=A0A2Z6P1C0_TRISU|nr:hypothetical protein TSUD_131240 [Trifolium subterraneum]